MSTKKFTDWAVTAYDPEEVIAIRPYCSYLVSGKEVCPKTKRVHYQTFIQMKTTRNMQQLKAIMPTSHLEPRRGSVEDNLQYCMKEGDFHQEGQVTDHPGQGFRSDIENFVEDAKTQDRASMYASHTDVMIRYPRAYAQVKDDFSVPRVQPTRLRWLFGEPGTGKSKFVMLRSQRLSSDGARVGTGRVEGLYDKQPTSLWWDGYRGQRVIRADELTSQSFPFNDLLKHGDPGDLILPVKGGFVKQQAEELYVTTNHLPDKIYQGEYFPALARRCKFFECKRNGNGVSKIVQKVFNGFDWVDAEPYWEQTFVVPADPVDDDMPYV